MGQQRAQNVGVRCRRGRVALRHQPSVPGACGKFSGVDEIPVVPQCNPGICRGVAEHGLGVFPGGIAGSGVTAVPDGDVAVHCGQRLLVEHLTDQTEVLEDQNLGSIGYGDPRRFLATML